MKDETVESQIWALNMTILNGCLPKTIVCDKHSVYTSQMFRNWALDSGITLHISPGYSTTHVSLVNRMHRTMREMLVRTRMEANDWAKCLHHIIQAYNNTVHPALGFTPTEVIYGNKPWTKTDKAIGIKIKPTAGDKESKITEMQVYRELAKEIVKEKTLEARGKMIQNFLDSRSSKKPLQPEVGDRVYRKSPHDNVKEGKRTAVRCFGPYIVTRIDEDGVHAYVKKELLNDPPEERVLISWLMPAKDRVLVQIYPKTDLCLKPIEKTEEDKKNSIYQDESYMRSNPNHPYGTRFKPKNNQ